MKTMSLLKVFWKIIVRRYVKKFSVGPRIQKRYSQFTIDWKKIMIVLIHSRLRWDKKHNKNRNKSTSQASCIHHYSSVVDHCRVISQKGLPHILYTVHSFSFFLFDHQIKSQSHHNHSYIHSHTQHNASSSYIQVHQSSKYTTTVDESSRVESSRVSYSSFICRFIYSVSLERYK